MFARLGTDPLRFKLAAAALLAFVWFLVYLTTVSPTVNFIDSGELITALHEPGIAHPPGYPLYVLMGYVVSHLLWGDVAWRVNVLSAFWGALAVGALFVMVVDYSTYILDSARPAGRRAGRQQPKQPNMPKQSRGKEKQPARAVQQSAAQLEDTAYPTYRAWVIMLAGTGSASLLAASSTFWSRTAQAKMYSLHYFFAFAVFSLALSYRRAHESNNEQQARRRLFIVAALLGLSFTNHLTTLLLLVPVAVLLLVGSDMPLRFRALLKRLPVALVLFALPLLLYLYLPFRTAQNPIMNWGSPDTWGDFWRHLSGWQFRPYLVGDISGNMQRNTPLIAGYAAAQWALLTPIVFIAGIVGALFLWRANWTVGLATAAYALATIMFSLVYGISEIEPYIVPFYAMFAVWIGLAPASWLAVRIQSSPRSAPPENRTALRPLWWAGGVAVAAAVLSALFIYPTQNYSKNHLAEQFAMNVFNQLPQNSIVITDYWDFYAPTYYLQLLQGVRPDLVLVDKSLLKYPFYTQQLRNRYPWLIEKSQDIVAPYAVEQRKFVNGEAYDQVALPKLYADLMTSFFERNPDHPAYLLTIEQCNPSAPQQCEAGQIAPTWTRRDEGLVTQLLPQRPRAQDVPAIPDYKLEGILTNPVSLDDAARINSSFYVDAYLKLAALYESANQPDNARRMSDMATEVRNALRNR